MLVFVDRGRVVGEGGEGGGEGGEGERHTLVFRGGKVRIGQSVKVGKREKKGPFA